MLMMLNLLFHEHYIYLYLNPLLCLLMKFYTFSKMVLYL